MPGFTVELTFSGTTTDPQCGQHFGDVAGLTSAIARTGGDLQLANAASLIDPCAHRTKRDQWQRLDAAWVPLEGRPKDPHPSLFLLES